MASNAHEQDAHPLQDLEDITKRDVSPDSASTTTTTILDDDFDDDF